ncbi:MAG: pilus assembly protein [Proteobacteria bacterium]|nr:MAG: pilus assembly protein [Pseudomonadota bacterium]PIE66830.1 MAG: pilus assembly protein [Deltaproteobacteria bacterium]
MANAEISLPIEEETGHAAMTEAQYKSKIDDIGKRLGAAKNLAEALINLKDEICELFGADRITVYVVDGVKRELVSRFKSGSEVAEIRIPVAPTSIAGYAALKQTLVNIKDVYNHQELKAIDPEIQFDSSWDRRTSYRTREILAYPIVYQRYLMGTLELINRKAEGGFSRADEKAIQALSKIMGIALYNQKRIAARVGRTNKYDYLLENHLLTQKELAKAISDAAQKKEPVSTILMKDYEIPKKEIGSALEKYFKTNFIEYNPSYPIPGDLIQGLKVSFMRTNIWVPLKSEDNKVVVAVDNPHDLKKIDEIKALFPGRLVTFYVSLKQDILDFIKLFTQDEKELAEIDDILSQLQDEAEEVEEAESSMGEEDSAVVQLVNKIILDAYSRSASDIHIEPYPGKQNTQVRIRVDGSCTVYQTIPFSYKNAVISRIKIMSDLDIAERRLPQDGKIKFKKYGGKDIELRVATIPTQGGLEDVVMRILAAGEPIPLDKLGLSKRNHKQFISCVTKPYGLIFVCGPTGSGKTTSLHSAMSFINRTETKIWTAEDPVEITQRGLRQVQVKPKIGFDFAAAMRAFLRADPDVIMVGEMRDKETTSIGIEASLTGHLVFSTLHTNSAPESITRLLDMGMDPFNFADAILCIMAQRLVRTLCKACKREYHPSREEFDELVREYGEAEFQKNLGIEYTDDLMLNKAEGCDLCNNTGYRGRMGIHELLMGTDEMKKLIQTKAEMKIIREQAIGDGMTTLKQDGIEKVFLGHCDLLEVRKVCIK